MRTEADAVSRWARYANNYLLLICCKRGGFCEYDQQTYGSTLLLRAKNPGFLERILEAKADVVAEAESMNRAGTPMPDADFKSALRDAIDAVIGVSA